MTHIDQVLIKSADFWNENKPTIAGAGLGGLLGAGLGGIFAGVDDDDTLSEAFVKRLKTALAGAALGGITGGGAGYVLDQTGVVDSLKNTLNKLIPKQDGSSSNRLNIPAGYILDQNIDFSKALDLNNNTNDGKTTLLTGPQFSKADINNIPVQKPDNKEEKKDFKTDLKNTTKNIANAVADQVDSGADLLINKLINPDTLLPWGAGLADAVITGRGAWKGWNTGAYAKNIEKLEHKIDRANREFAQLSSYVNAETTKNEQQANKDSETKAKLFEQMQKEEVENKNLKDQYQREFDDQISNNKRMIDEAQARVDESNKNLEIAKAKKTTAESALTDVNNWYKENNREGEISPTSEDLDKARLDVEQFTKELEHNKKLLAEVQKNIVKPKQSDLQTKLDSILYPYRDQYNRFVPSPIDTPIARKYNGRIQQLEGEINKNQRKLDKQNKLNDSMRGKLFGAAKGATGHAAVATPILWLLQKIADRAFYNASGVGDDNK